MICMQVQRKQLQDLPYLYHKADRNLGEDYVKPFSRINLAKKEKCNGKSVSIGSTKNGNSKDGGAKLFRQPCYNIQLYNDELTY